MKNAYDDFMKCMLWFHICRRYDAGALSERDMDGFDYWHLNPERWNAEGAD